VPQPKITSSSNEPYSEQEVEVVITAKLRQMDDANWSLSVSSTIGNQQWQMGGTRVTIPDEEMRWTRQVPSREGSTLGTRGTKSLDPEGPIVLLQWRAREMRTDGSFGRSADPMPGYAIWLEKAP
jgi:hypothetical protein